VARDAAIHEAIDRWAEKGLVSDELAMRLRTEVRLGEEGRLRRVAQYAIATAGGLVLLLAGGIFVGRGWGDLGDAARTFLLAGIGLFLQLAGAGLERRQRVRPVGYLLQASGLVFLLIAYAYSDEVWKPSTPGALVVALLALATPVLSALRSLRQDPVMPSVNAALSYGFVAVALSRLGMDADGIVWALDAVMIVSLLAFAAALRRSGPDRPEAAARALYGLVTSLFAGLILTGFTSVGPLDAGGNTIFALDLWLAVLLALALWAVHRAPPWLRRGWYDNLLASLVLVSAVFASITLHELDVDSDLVGLGAVAVGGIAIAYALKSGTRPVLLSACTAVVVGVWMFGISMGETVGALGSLAVTAALLFWVSARVGREEELG